ncbi:MAG: phosphoribosylformylglycinamidine synthase subunit PurS [Thermotogae bacterium]|nr:phosphoribosylformylglycinamidine synthase subunit PurS [Thermotogota bacterium]
MRFKFRVIVMPKRDLLDPQGRAVAGVLRDMGVRVEDVRVGKSINLIVEAESEEEAERTVDRIARDVLSNPIIEDYTVQRL